MLSTPWLAAKDMIFYALCCTHLKLFNTAQLLGCPVKTFNIPVGFVNTLKIPISEICQHVYFWHSNSIIAI
ncbi:hypothetical protein [Piscirickettsia salmonis]|uniref:hypothetical protein n=1 Tax=Piscirickettsia salmonis TaxID=1238 RepID=UPI001187720C|nr:hypothetical protein [Piscirickettsia salmonis]